MKGAMAGAAAALLDNWRSRRVATRTARCARAVGDRLFQRGWRSDLNSCWTAARCSTVKFGCCRATAATWFQLISPDPSTKPMAEMAGRANTGMSAMARRDFGFFIAASFSTCQLGFVLGCELYSPRRTVTTPPFGGCRRAGPRTNFAIDH